MKRNDWIGLWALAVMMFQLVGCGGDSLPLVEVTGTVSYRGKPVPDARVTFQPKDGPPAFGTSDSTGNFTLKTNGRDGAVAEAAKVSVVAVEELKSLPPSDEHPEGVLETRSLIPEKYALIASTPLEVTISSTGDNHFYLDLTD